jgi:hypothetical protein
MQKIIDVIITDIDKLGLPFLLIQKQRVLPDTFAVCKDFVTLRRGINPSSFFGHPCVVASRSNCGVTATALRA